MEWRAFFELEPWGCEVENLRAAQAPTMLANIHRKKNAAMVHVRDMAFRFDEDPEELAEKQAAGVERVAEIHDAIAAAHERARMKREAAAAAAEKEKA